MSRSRILWLKSAIPWPLDQGTNFIALNLFRLLAPEFDIRYPALRRGPEDDFRLEALREIVEVESLDRPNLRSPLHRLLSALAYRVRRTVRFVPPEVHYELPRVWRQRVRRLALSGEFDLLFAHYWFLGELGPWLASTNAAFLLHDYEPERLRLAAAALPDGARKRGLLRTADYSFRSHLRLMERARRVFFYTDADRDRFFEEAGREYPNAGLFPYYYRVTDVPEVPEDPDTVLFSGKMSYLPNVLAAERLARRIWPLVREARPDARLVLAGGSPAPEVRALADVPGVEVTGYLDDLRSVVRAAAVYVSPVTVGGGLKIKLMEASELARPIVANAFSLSGFGYRPGVDYAAAETDAGFAREIVDLLGSPERRHELGAAARRALEERFSGPAVRTRTLSLFRELVAGRTLRSPSNPGEGK